MLVLARRQSEKLVFPNLGITIHVVRVDNKGVRLGVEAPQDVTVLRHEIADSWTQWRDYPLGQRPGDARDALRHRLSSASLRLHQLHRQVESGELAHAETTILKVFRELQSMEKELANLKEHQHPQNQRPRQALLIEDNRNESELLAGFLRTCNFQVATASDRAGALEYLAYKEEPDVVLMNMNLAGTSGPDTVYEIRNNPKTAGLKIFALTEHSPDVVKVPVGTHGVDRWFNKPIQPDFLVAEINRELLQCA